MTQLTDRLREYFSGYTRYYFEDITVNGRSSIKEHDQDLQVRKEMWHTLVGDVAIDCGAGFGSYTITALANAASFVFAFEQDPIIATCLRTNLQSNRMLMATERATVSAKRLDDSQQTVDKYMDELSYPLNRLDWIKIDVGDVPNNRLVLWGCKHLIKQFRPQLLIADPEPPSVSFLDGYKITKIINGHSLLLPNGVF